MNRHTALVAATWSIVAFLAPALCYSALPAKDEVEIDTLSMYSSKTGYVTYDHPGVIRQAARFQASGPSYLRQVTLLFSGTTGTVLLRICGHEGGLSAPVLGKDLQEPVMLKKERVGMEKISVPINNLLLQNDQFFVVVEQLSAGVKLLSDREKKVPACIIPNGEKYVYQYLQKADSTWEYGAYGYAIDAEVAVPKVRESVLYHDTAAVVTNQSHIQMKTNCRSIASADINNDGYLDLLAGGRLYINNGHGQFYDKSDSVGLQGTPQAHCFIDIDNNGRTDILFLGITVQTGNDSTAPVIANTLYLNQGRGKLKKMQLQLPPLYSISSFSIGDITGDGYADLFIGQCLQPGIQYQASLKNYVLVNNQKLSFEDKTSFLSASDGQAASHPAVCRGASFVDINNDNLTDLYIANYYGYNDELWVNTGGTFQRKELNSGTDTTAILSIDGVPVSPEWYSSGCHWMDADNNGSPDLLSARYLNPVYVRTMSTEPTSVKTLYEAIEETAKQPTVQKQESIFDFDERHSAGVWGDINNDSRMDCLLLTSCECNNADFYQQQENLSFSVQTRTYGVDRIANANDALWIDVNNDGALDLVFLNDSLIVYRNRGIEIGHYTQLDLQSDNNVAGAKVQVFTSTGMYTQQVSSGRGLLMQDPLRLHFGLSESEKIDSIRVVWPGSPNYWETFTSAEIDRINALKEGTGTQRGNYDRNLMKITGVRSYPNPFRESVNIEFQLLEPVHVSLEIYDMQGNKIVNLLDRELETGVYKAMWDVQNSNGTKLPTGTYLYHCTVGGAKIIGKLIHIE